MRLTTSWGDLGRYKLTLFGYIPLLVGSQMSKNYIQRSLKPPAEIPGKPQTDDKNIFHLPSVQFPTQLAIRETIERQGKGLFRISNSNGWEISHKTAGFTGVQNIYSRWFIRTLHDHLPFGIGKPSILTLRYRVSPYPKTSFFSDRLLFGVRNLKEVVRGAFNF